MGRWRSSASLVVAGAVATAVAGCSTAQSVVTSGDAPSPHSPARPTSPTSPVLSPEPQTTDGTSPPATGPAPPAPTPTSAAVVPSGAELKIARSQPVEDPYYPDTSNPEIDVLHYFLDLAWDGTTLRGTTTVTARVARPTPVVRLDLSAALRVSEVSLDGRPLAFHQAGDGLTMDTGRLARGSTYTLVITYAGSPRAVPAPSLRPDLADGLGWVVDGDGSVHTFQEPYGAFTWYPVNDHPSDEALYDASIATPAGSVAVFNGELVSSKGTDSGTVNAWHVDEPVASYLVTLAIGPYREHTVITPSGMSISFWLQPRDDSLLPGLQQAASDAFEWLVDSAGPYPFSTLGIVVVGGNSGMETQTMITLSRGSVRRPDAVVEHEMAHQWFGDSVTPTDWQGLWLNEGWAMYMQQWYETDTGIPPYAGGLDHWRVYDLKSRLVSGPPGDYDPKSFGDVNVYLGPALLLDRIRQRVGDAEFEQLVKDWAAEHENAAVDRGVFRAWLRAQTGQDFGPLMHEWLDSTRTPR